MKVIIVAAFLGSSARSGPMPVTVKMPGKRRNNVDKVCLRCLSSDLNSVNIRLLGDEGDRSLSPSPVNFLDAITLSACLI